MKRFCFALLFLLASLSVVTAQPAKKQRTHVTAAKTTTLQCLVDEQLNRNVTSLKCVIDRKVTYQDVPRTLFRFHNCKTVNLVRDSEGHLQIAEVQPKQCVVERAHKCDGAELSDDYPRNAMQGPMPCKRE